MNFLVSANPEVVLQFQPAMMERGDVVWLVSFAELLSRQELTDAGLVVLDFAVPGFSGLDDIKQLKRKNKTLKILLAGTRLAPDQELAALATGVNGCCSPDLNEGQVHRILSIVEESGVWVTNAALPKLLQRLRNHDGKGESEGQASGTKEPAPMVNPLAELTQREQEIAGMVAAGDSNKIIARKLDISDRTVKAHLTAIFQKLNVSDRLQLALYVSRGGQSS